MTPPRLPLVKALVALVMAGRAGVGAAQIRVIITDGEVVVEQAGGDAEPPDGNPFELGPPAPEPPALAAGLQLESVMQGNGLPADAAGPTIGDPWWDDVPEPAPAVRQVPRAPARPRVSLQHRGQAMESLRRELSLVRAACPGLAPGARGAIVAAGRTAAGDRPAGSVEAAVARAVQAAAGPAEVAAFRREVVAREARRRAAAAAVLVEAVDQDALLDDRTRQALSDALAAAWRPTWDQVGAAAARQRFTGTRLPPGVEAVVASVLDADSLAAWRERREPTKP